MRVEYNDDREVLNKSTSENTQYPIVEAWDISPFFLKFWFQPIQNWLYVWSHTVSKIKYSVTSMERIFH